MRKLTANEFKAVEELIKSTEWIKNEVNYQLNRGKGWNEVLYQVAKAFNLLETND